MIGLLLARRCPTIRVLGIELQRELASHAAANARANGLAERCHFVCADLREAPRLLPAEHFHRIVANPPYRKPGSGAPPPDRGRAAARLECSFGIPDLARVSSAQLRFGGTLDVIHLAERLTELITSLAVSGLEPKVLRLVAPFPGSPPHLCLVSAVKGGRPGLRILPALAVNEAPGLYSSEVLTLFEPEGAVGSRTEKALKGK